jgi:hypothetical protein
MVSLSRGPGRAPSTYYPAGFFLCGVDAMFAARPATIERNVIERNTEARVPGNYVSDHPHACSTARCVSKLYWPLCSHRSRGWMELSLRTIEFETPGN